MHFSPYLLDLLSIRCFRRLFRQNWSHELVESDGMPSGPPWSSGGWPNNGRIEAKKSWFYTHFHFSFDLVTSRGHRCWPWPRVDAGGSLLDFLGRGEGCRRRKKKKNIRVPWNPCCYGFCLGLFRFTLHFRQGSTTIGVRLVRGGLWDPSWLPPWSDVGQNRAKTFSSC